MPRIIIIIFIAICGYYAYRFYSSGNLGKTKETVTETAKAVTIPKELPARFLGRYVSDLRVNVAAIKAAKLPPKASEIMLAGAGKVIVEIGPKTWTSQLGGKVQKSPLDIVDVGEDYFEVEYHHKEADLIFRSRITLDREGIWVVTPVGPYVLKERYRKMK